ncbi:MAG: hypothetical protein PHD15_02275 [Clostridia bacterium]|nr:hypothetical protein [Clostridia bacterium]MDD4386573.1 hypothetical protein [Clostridia bacterium]
MFVGVFRKTIGLFLLAMGIGVILALLLPFWGWIVLVATALIILRHFMVSMLNKGGVIYENSCI